MIDEADVRGATEYEDRTVLVEPSGIRFGFEAGQTIMAAAERSGLVWPTVCGGEATCRACIVEVLGGTEAHLDDPGTVERTALRGAFHGLEASGLPVRLACQARPFGPITVRKRGVRPKVRTTAGA